MSQPMIIDIPHKLGREEAKRRLKSRTGELASFIPGGAADVRSAWPSDNRMTLDVDAMGQSVSTVIDVEETHVTLQLRLPAMLGFMASAIEGAIRKGGAKLLLDDKTKP